MLLFLVCSALSLWVSSGSKWATSDNPHVHYHPKHEFLDAKPMKLGNLKGSDYAVLTASPNVVTSPDEYVVVNWYNVTYTTDNDIIGLFNDSTDPLTLYGPPIKFKYLSPSGKYPPSSGSIKFKLLNRRTNYIFAYISASTGYREIVSVSNVVTYSNLYEPMHAHISVVNPVNNKAVTGDFAIQVMWVQKAINNPTVKYGTSASNLNMSISYNGGSNGYITTYDPSMLCDAAYGQPSSLSGWLEPGHFINFLLQGLRTDTMYFYQVGESSYGWTDVFNFTSPCPNGGYSARDNTVKFIGFGDLGNMAIDFSKHHSWDWNDDGELYSINTTSTIYKYYVNGNKDISDFLIHTGDISYAVGYESEWDDFMHQIGPIANHIPYMTGIGNHEYAWSGEWIPPVSQVSSDSYGTSDSGGECGVPYNSFFPFASVNSNSPPGPNDRQPWYTFDYGVVRVVVMSTEHNFSEGSPQYEYLVNTLENTDRTTYPWIFFTGHRPMYVDSTFDGDATLSQYMVGQLEPLFKKYKISVGMWGHAHQYGRTCPIYAETCYSDGEAPIHIVYGMAGYELSSSSGGLKYFVESDHTHYGFMHFTVMNSSHCYTKFVNSADGSVLDSFYIINQYSD